MKITQLRNASIILHIGEQHILVDPMLAVKYALPPLRFFDGQRERNPTVDLPGDSATALAAVTHCLITHCQKGHFDHLDRAAKRWLREKQIPVLCTPHDAAYLQSRGLHVQALADTGSEPQAFFGGRLSMLPCRHGRGWIARFMEHGVGYFIEMPGEPSLYLAGDTVLTDEVRDFVLRRQPQISVVPAGGAHMDMGQEIIMGVDEVIAFTRLSQGVVIANHLEALSHCPATRSALALAAQTAGVAERLHIPADGQTLDLSALAALTPAAQNGHDRRLASLAPSA